MLREPILVGGVYRTRDGCRARVLAVDRYADDQYPVVALVDDQSNGETVRTYMRNGNFDAGYNLYEHEHMFDLVEELVDPRAILWGQLDPGQQFRFVMGKAVVSTDTLCRCIRCPTDDLDFAGRHPVRWIVEDPGHKAAQHMFVFLSTDMVFPDEDNRATMGY